MSPISLQFDPAQQHQLEAVEAICGLFNNLTEDHREFELKSQDSDIPANLPNGEELDWLALQENFQNVCEGRKLPVVPLVRESALVLDGAGSEVWEYPSFTVEMETGTGKTYVYLRSIFELKRRFGFRKFIIVVPSVAIYEGVVKTFAITRDHFGQLYKNERVGLTKYDGSALSRLRDFALSDSCEILVMTLDSFNQASGRTKNNLYKRTDKLPGERVPYKYLQETRPILILDEPQNMGSSRARQALATLHPLFALRFSATHREAPNRIYQLTPFDAFRRNLVKRIEVFGCVRGDDYAHPLLKLESISTAGALTAQINVVPSDGGGAQPRLLRVRHGDDLFERTGRAELRGFIVENIDRLRSKVEFSNGTVLVVGDELGDARVHLFRTQIRETITRHLERQQKLRERKIKVISLFFIDRVANYLGDKPLIRTIFSQEWTRLRKLHDWAKKLTADEVQAAYFAEMKSGTTLTPHDIELDEGDRNAAQREAARAAFNLIMRDKERLLDLENPVAFIFAHSALKEGWDNPNVFQICTLNETRSELKKRQEIGRGLRLCVGADGNRVQDESVNQLLVVTNESYTSFASNLQNEYRTDGVNETGLPPNPTNARSATAKRNDDLFLRNSPFKKFWNQLSEFATPSIDVDTNALVAECIERVSRKSIPRPRILVQKAAFTQYRYDLTVLGIANRVARIRVVRESTARDDTNWNLTVRSGDNLGRSTGDSRINSIIVEDVKPQAVQLGDRKITQGESVSFELANEQVERETAVAADPTDLSIPNLIDRAARDAGITRQTVLRVFRGLPDRVQRQLRQNPEGFASVFLTEMRNAVADHVAERVSFLLIGKAPLDLEDLFPPSVRYVQREAIDAGQTGLYDIVQKDSEVESAFVDRLKMDPEVVCFFKFPSAFKVRFPKVIGNYNPDWGIIRRNEAGDEALYLVRETKGSEQIGSLRFPHEKRKVKAAYRYFATIGADYRVVTDQTVDWWTKQDIEDQLRLPD